MRRNIVILIQFSLALPLFLGGIPLAQAQFFASCEGKDAVAELKDSIHAHNEHITRLDHKFLDYVYFQGVLKPEEVLSGTLLDVEQYLGKLTGRKAAIIFYAFNEPHLCTWLMWHEKVGGKDVISQATRIDQQKLLVIPTIDELKNEEIRQLGRLRASGRGATPMSDSTQVERWEEDLVKASHWLLRDRISEALLELQVDTLMVVPITVKRQDESFASIGTVPFAALRLGKNRDQRLLDHMSVVIAPGFYVFTEKPIEQQRPLRRKFTSRNAIIVGDPDGTLPGARAEAEEIGRLLDLSPLIGQEATKARVIEELKAHSDNIGLLHIAAHGYAHSEHPLDNSYLQLYQRRWTAREISGAALNSRPLVVMSACETGLGKDFGVGTIGLARAWQWAGTSNVIMSLWNVNDLATRNLMKRFIEKASEHPADKALQAAMQAMCEDPQGHGKSTDSGGPRSCKKMPNPYLWAGFTVFGTPEPIAGPRNSLNP